MIRIGKIFFVFIAIFLALWLLPWFYHFTTDTPGRVPFTLYSTVVKDFAYMDRNTTGKLEYWDCSGNEYSHRQFDSILPLFYFRQLASDGRLPDTLNGLAVNPHKIRTGNFIFRTAASEMNVRKPALYPLMESMSGRVDLEMPDDVCRYTEDGIEFIDMETNTVDEAKSSLFTSLMKKKGFVFPMTCIGGNPTERKEFDNGYFLTDSEGKLFHLKQVCGRPFFRPVPLPDGMEIRHIVVREFAARKFHAFLADRENRLWVLGMPGYDLHRLPVGEYDPSLHDLDIVGDLFNWTVALSREGGTSIYALDAADYSLVDTLIYPLRESTARKLGRYIFPFEIRFTSYNDQYVYPRIEDFSVAGLWLPALLVGLVCYRLRRKH